MCILVTRGATFEKYGRINEMNETHNTTMVQKSTGTYRKDNVDQNQEELATPLTGPHLFCAVSLLLDLSVQLSHY